MMKMHSKFSCGSPHSTPSFHCSSERGSVLIISLILLLVITILGMANIRTSTMEFKMSSSAKDRNLAFEGAEAVLSKQEQILSASSPAQADVFNGCTGVTCYNKTCENGLCFQGVYAAGDNDLSCKATEPLSSGVKKNFWSDSLDVWNTSTKHKTMAVSGLDNDPKYIVEFLCFVEEPGGASFGGPDILTVNNGEPLFRVTALAEGNTGARVMLQSTFILPGAF